MMNTQLADLLSRVKIALFAGLIALAIIPVAYAGLSDSDKSEIEALIIDYISENPEFIRDALDQLAAREAAQQQQLALSLVRMDE